MKLTHFLFALLFLTASSTEARAKELALTFDDAPMDSTPHFESFERSRTLIRKLKALNVPTVMIFANACSREDSSSVIKQLKEYKDTGHLIANHTCSHPRLDEVGFDAYSKDAAKGDELLTPLLFDQKFLRYPFLNEGTDAKVRDKMRSWLAAHHYRNGMVSIDNDDYIFSFKINQAKSRGKQIPYDKVKQLFLSHMLGAVAFYDTLAQKTLGRSPKHVLLLHEMDATVLYIDSLIKELRRRGWKIISPAEAFQDPLYSQAPRNTYAGNGIVAQIAYERTGRRQGYDFFEKTKIKLDRILGLR